MFSPFTPISLACMLLHVAITLFSPAHPHAHFMFLLSSQTWSLDVSLEKCHTLPIIIHYTVFIISHVSTVLSYHQVPKLSFSPPHTQSPLVFHFFFLPMGFSHTPYMSLHMTHTTKITLSLLQTQHLLRSPFRLHPRLTLFICLPIRQPRLPSPLSLSQTHTHNSCFHSPSRLPSLSHTHKTLAFAPRLVFLSQTFIDQLASRQVYTPAHSCFHYRIHVSLPLLVSMQIFLPFLRHALSIVHTHTIASF